MKMYLRSLVAVIAVGMFLSLQSCSSKSNPTDTSGGDNNPPANTINIAGLAYSPSSITIKAGTKLTWTNKDSVPHTVTSDDGGFTSSGNLSLGATYEVTFTTPGTYPYHCTIHPSMKGTVIVTE